MDDKLLAAIKLHPEVLNYLPLRLRAQYYKAEPITRDQFERNLGKVISKADAGYLAVIESAGPYNIPADFWIGYEESLRQEISAPLRRYIEQSFSNYSDYVDFIDATGAITDIDTEMTRAIASSASDIAANTQKQLQAIIAEGGSQQEIIDRLALRFSSGHAEQVAVTEITRAEGYFSQALSDRLAEQGITSRIRWLTSEDEKVCPICGPADHKLKDDPITTSRGGWNGQTWGDRFGNPPAHPRCRCQTVVEAK